VQTSIKAIGEAEAMSLMDYKYGFLQKVIKDSDRDIVSFVTQDGQHRFKKMCYGMKTAPSSLMRTQTKIFSDLINKCVIVYFDLVFSKSIKEHFEHLRLIFERIRSSGVTLKPKKYFFFKTEITFLGYGISKAGIDADPDKVRAIVDFPTPQNIRHIRSFIGLAGFYRRKVKNFAIIAEPLTRSTKKEYNPYPKDICADANSRKQFFFRKDETNTMGT
jgi:hypothetical protein